MRPAFRFMGALALACVCLASAAGTAAAEVTIEGTVDRTTVPIDGQVVYTITVSSGLRQAPAPDLPPLESDWTVYSAGTSRNFSMVNGQVSSSSAYRYVLTPRRPGRLVIGKARVKVGSTTHETAPITITVTPAQGGAGPGGLGPAPGEERTSGGDRDLFITTSVDRKTPYVHEQVLLTFRFYQRVNLLESPDYTAPTTTGFWSEDLPPQRTFNEVINGRRYYVTEVKTALFPTAPGTLTISGARLSCVVPSVSRSVDRDPFSLFGQSIMNSRRITLESDPITLQVKPLPPGAPPGFGGAVGRFSLGGSVDKATLPQGEPVTLRLEVTGTGNVKTVPDITLPALQEFKIYDSSSSSDVDKSGGTVRGRKTSEQILVPLKAGTLTIPPVSLVYFDPGRGEYMTTSTSPLVIQVAAGSGSGGGAGPGRSAIEVVGQDIRFIRTQMDGVRVRGHRIWDSPLFWFFQALPAGVMIASLVYERRRRRLEHDLGFARGIRSGREAGRRLKRARDLIGSGDPAFYSEVAAALRGYVADKFNRSAAGLTREEIGRLLSERGVDGSLNGRLAQVLDQCDQARFSPSADGLGNRERMLDEAAELIQSLRRSGL